MSTPTMIIAAPTSGAGKTTVTLALLRALKNRGLRVGSAKVGPDYIDPGFHARATDRPCLNLDSWAMRFETLAGLIDDAGRDCDMLIIEGVMGLFDGAPNGAGSTADIAALFDLPITFVVDSRRMGASAAALVKGFMNHRDDVEIASIIFNRAGSANHRQILRDACDDHFSTPILGYLPKIPELSLPQRHLGLIQAHEHPALDAFIEHAAGLVERELDLDRMIRLARRPGIESVGIKAKPIAPIGQRIAVAKDAAFAFIYQATINGWHRAGAEISFFSPLMDEAPHKDADAVYLPGGYPELNAERLSNAQRLFGGLRAAAGRDALIFGECGGYMLLGERLIDKQGTSWQMAGLLPVSTSFATPHLHLGYRQIEMISPSRLARVDAQFRGHEFHYATEIDNRGAFLFSMKDARALDIGKAGCVQGSVCGSFAHLIDRFTHLRAID